MLQMQTVMVSLIELSLMSKHSIGLYHNIKFALMILDYLLMSPF
jgi:hypothetical protein